MLSSAAVDRIAIIIFHCANIYISLRVRLKSAVSMTKTALSELPLIKKFNSCPSICSMKYPGHVYIGKIGLAASLLQKRMVLGQLLLIPDCKFVPQGFF